MRKYKVTGRQAVQEIAAARLGIRVRSARRIEKAEKLSSVSGIGNSLLLQNWKPEKD